MIPPRGSFYLYDSANPALKAGRYVLTSSLALTAQGADGAGASTPVEALATHITVTAPRLRLPPDQALQVFPPANSEGAYETRLPQIVLKSRTLPWDRAAAPVNSTINGQTVEPRTPWLALVVIAEGEGTVVHDAAPADCVSPGVSLSGDMDVARASYLSVPKSTVDRIFPTIEDLALLTHVRQVNLDDTELALGDDDGFLAVVIANRMPQFDRETCRPKAYTACLISLEGQLDALPPPAPPVQSFRMDDIYVSEFARSFARSVEAGTAIPVTATGTPRSLDISDGTALTDAIRRGEVVFHEGRLIDRGGVASDGQIATLGTIPASALLEGELSALVRDEVLNRGVSMVAGSFGGFTFPLDQVLRERFYRFPLLTSWRFTCSGAGGFEHLMKSLDVGLLGTPAGEGYRRPLAECTPAIGGVDPGAAPVTQLPLEISETGHIRVDHVTRTGHGRRAWYRGPLSPHQLLRNPLAEETHRPVLAHVSDHLRMMTPEGNEDLSLAVAFETGRLLALSHPSFVASMLRWRSEQFGAARARAMQRAVVIDRLPDLGRLIPNEDIERLRGALERGLISREIEGLLLREVERGKTLALGDRLPLTTPGLRVPELAGDLADILALGLGMDRGLAQSLVRNPGDAKTIAALHRAEPGVAAATPLSPGAALDQGLAATLDRGVARLAELSVGAAALESGRIDRAPQFDRIEDFLAARPIR